MIRFGLPALFALFALALCAGHASQAQAACGDWLASHGQPTDQHQANPIDAPPRCSGPACQQQPVQEPRPPISSVTIVVDKAALVAESFADVSAQAPDCFAKPVSDVWPASALRSPLERPPRS